MAARQTALGALIACRKQGAWSDGVLKEYAQRDRLDRRDAALATRLCYGVLQNRMLLDFYLSQLVRGRLRDLQPVVLDILRLGLYQIFYMDKIPDSAAVHEAVEQGKQYANPRAAGLVNGVLRGSDSPQGSWPNPRIWPPGTAILSPWWSCWPEKWDRRSWRGCWLRTTRRRRRCCRGTLWRGTGLKSRQPFRRPGAAVRPIPGWSAAF